MSQASAAGRGALVHNQSMYYIYTVKKSIGKLYVGITTNPYARVKQHNQKRDAQLTKYKTDFKIVFLEQHQTTSEARKREIQIKKWRRDKKEMPIKRFAAGLPTKQS